MHNYKLIFGFNNHFSDDTIFMCANCGVVKHDYTPKSINYPVYFSTIAGNSELKTGKDEPECII